MALTKITNALVSVNAIQGTLIADNAITAVHIATNAVSSTLIADNAITAVHIAQNVITVTQLADDAVEADKIADGVITTNHLNSAMISSQTAVTANSSDYVLIGDASDSNALKKALVSDFGNTSEQIQDIAGAMFTSNTETGITATYEDGDGTIDLVVGTLNQNTTGTAATVTTAAQTAITSVGTLTSLAVTNNTTVGGTLGVTGATTFNEDVTITKSSGDVTLLLYASENSGSREPALQLKGYSTNSNPIIQFGDNVGFPGGIEYENQDNSMMLHTNGAVALTLSSAQLATFAGAATVTGALTGSSTITTLTNFNSTSGNDLRLNAGSANRDIFMQVNGTTHMTVQGSTGKVLIGAAEAATVGKAIVMAMVFG
jgi:hypothetical protein